MLNWIMLLNFRLLVRVLGYWVFVHGNIVDVLGLCVCVCQCVYG